MKPPFSYYGGKQRMASKVTPLIPKHTVYVEPFAGSCAVLFAKPWPNVTNTHHYREVINDTNGDVVNFFKQLRDNGEELAKICALTPYSREEHKIAKKLDISNNMERARRFFVNINQSFANVMFGGWVTGVFGRNFAVSWMRCNTRLLQTSERLADVHIEHDDAISVIKRWDSPQTFFYCDPPYPGANQGHYSGYTDKDFAALVDTLDKCQGSFLLSCYGFEAPEHWEKFIFQVHCTASCKGTTGSNRDKTKAATNLGDRKRTEVVYRVIRGENVRQEIKQLYATGKFDCFTGKRPDDTSTAQQLGLDLDQP